MTEIKRLIRSDFDNLENRMPNAISFERVKTFVGTNKLTAQGVAEDWIDKHLESVKPYLGWDGNIYPKFTLETEHAE